MGNSARTESGVDTSGTCIGWPMTRNANMVGAKKTDADCQRNLFSVVCKAPKHEVQGSDD